MEANLTRITHKIAIQLHLVAEICTISSSSSRRPVRKLLDTSLQMKLNEFYVQTHDIFIDKNENKIQK